MHADAEAGSAPHTPNAIDIVDNTVNQIPTVVNNANRDQSNFVGSTWCRLSSSCLLMIIRWVFWRAY